MRRGVVILLVFAFNQALALPSEPKAPPLPREFRGVWVATVSNIDWPSKKGLPTKAQSETAQRGMMPSTVERMRSSLGGFALL